MSDQPTHEDVLAGRSTGGAPRVTSARTERSLQSSGLLAGMGAFFGFWMSPETGFSRAAAGGAAAALVASTLVEQLVRAQYFAERRVSTPPHWIEWCAAGIWASVAHNLIAKRP